MSLISQQVTMLRDCATAYKSTGLGKILEQAADTIEELSAKLHSENMERSEKYYRDNKVYIQCLESGELCGLRNCIVFYVKCVGDLEEIKALAAVNGIKLTKLSKIDFDYYVRNKR